MEKIGGINHNTVPAKQMKGKKGPKEKGSWRAVGASQVAGLVSLPAGLTAISGMTKINKKLTPEQIKKLNESADLMISMTGLGSKGVKIDDVRSAGLKLSRMPDSIYDLFNSYSAIAHGKNAGFLPHDAKDALTGKVLHTKNTIIVNREKMATATFHEIGHAFNANKSKFWGAMQKLRTPSMFLASSIALFAAFTKNAEPEEGKELTKAQKAKNFVRKNSGIIATTSMLPVVAEEIMASIRGCKWANANLPKELAKKVRTSNVWGAVSYIGAAIGLGISAAVATKVKDKIMEKQKAKFEAEQQKNNIPQKTETKKIKK